MTSHRQSESWWHLDGLIDPETGQLGIPTLTSDEVAHPQLIEFDEEGLIWQFTEWRTVPTRGMLDAFIRWLLPLGPAVEIVSPDAARDEYRRQVSSTLAHYAPEG